MSQSVFVQQDYNGNWPTVNQGGVDQTQALKSFTFQSGATAVGNGTVGDVSGYSTLAIRVSQTGTSQVQFEESMDNVNWSNITGYTVAGSYSLNVANASGEYRFNIAGIKYFRVRISSYTNGTIDVTGFASVGNSPIYSGSVTNGLGNGDGNSNTIYTQAVGAYAMVFNGSSTSGWDRLRGHQTSSQALASAARTATSSSADITNIMYRGIAVKLSVTVASGTGGLQMRIMSKESVSGNYIACNSLPTAITATGTYQILMYAGCDATNSALTQVINQCPAKTIRLDVVHGDSSSYTYSLTYEWLV